MRFSVVLAFLWAILAFLSSEILAARSSSSADHASASDHSDAVVNSGRNVRRINPAGESSSRKRKGCGSDDSSLNSSSSSDSRGSLTPISDTDSAKSDNGKQFAPGSLKFHNDGYEYHHAMGKYHQAIGDAYDRRLRNDPDAKVHWKAATSSQTKKIKHRKNYQGIKSGNLQPGRITEKKGMEKVPETPTMSEALRMINSRKIVFRQRKGLRYLQAKRLPRGKRRRSQPLDWKNDTSSSTD